MSPEQVREQSLTHQTDIFSLGVLMYQLLTGRLPFQGANNYSMIYQIINVDPPQPSQLRADLSPRIDAIVMRALKKDRSERYATWDEFAHDLVVARGGEDKLTRASPKAKSSTRCASSIFSGSSPTSSCGKCCGWRPGTTISAAPRSFRKATSARRFFILVSGQVKVVKQDRLLNLLKAGECFGEMAYLGKQKFQRSASVTSISDITVIEIRAETLTKASELCRHHFMARSSSCWWIACRWRTCGSPSCWPTATSASFERIRGGATP